MGVDDAWTIQDHFTATMVDILQWANFQRGEGKGQKPKPVPRPNEIKAENNKRTNMEMQALEAARRFKIKNR